MQPVDKLSTFVVFCDDLRQETGNKKSYMGVYTDELYIPALPALLPKFCIIVNMSCCAENVPEHLTVDFALEDETINRLKVPDDVLANWKAEAEKTELKDNTDCLERRAKERLSLEFYVSPFLVTREGVLKVHIETERGRAWAGSLAVVKKEGAPTQGQPILKKVPLQE